MFEKFSISDIDSAGRGGEYTVQAGFGWTNGVLLWVADTYGSVLATPTCPDLLEEARSGGNGGSGGSDGGNGAAGLRAAPLVSAVLAFVAAAVLL